MWDELEMTRVHGEFLSLAGTGEIWERVENVAWQQRENAREKDRAKQMDRRSRLPERLAHAAWERAARQRNKKTDGSVRCCAVCRQMYVVTKQQYIDGSRFCSRTCAARFSLRKRGGRIRPPRTATINGKTRTIVEWAKRFSLGFNTVCKRIQKGMSPEEALTARLGKKKSQHRMETIDGETRSFHAWAKHFDVSVRTVRRRISEGMSFESAVRTPRQRVYRPGGITYSDVEATANALVARGDKATTRAVQLALGGSINTIVRHLQAWRAKR